MSIMIDLKFINCPWNACRYHPHHNRNGFFNSPVTCWKPNSRALQLQLGTGKIVTSSTHQNGVCPRCKAFLPGLDAQKPGRRWPWWHPKPAEFDDKREETPDISMETSAPITISRGTGN